MIIHKVSVTEDLLGRIVVNPRLSNNGFGFKAKPRKRIGHSNLERVARMRIHIRKAETMS